MYNTTAKGASETRTAKYFLTFFFLLASLLFFTGNTQAQDTKLSVIVNQQGTQSTMTRTELRKVLRGEKQRWAEGAKVSVALMKTSNSVGEATAKQVYNMSGNELNKYWLALVFQGKAKAPVFFNSEADLAAFVRDTPGAIGVLQHDAAGSNKIAAIDGKDTL
jgi:ABC-type phosphate transport system substrate-binding protein